MRIWHQSITDLTRLPGYRTALAEHAAAVCEPSVAVDLHGVEPGTYPPGLAPIETTCYPWLSSLLTIQVVQNIIGAERAGYDAVIISCFLDPGLREARSAVDIPVVSALESALLAAPVVAGSVGLVGLGGAMAADMKRLADGYGLGGRIAAIVPVTPGITELEIDSPDSREAVVERVDRAAREAVAAGAELIVPAEGVLNAILVRAGVTELAGVPVLDSFGLLLSQAVSYAGLWRRTGLRTSRRGLYARAPEAARTHITAVTARAVAVPDSAPLDPGVPA
ncbi:MAG TPA: aspartate/glutamate racemase family protein [Trebonia sp.]